MTSKLRIIPTLLVSGNRMVKGKLFKNHKYVGDPINILRLYNDLEVDEIQVLDISASKYNKGPNPFMKNVFENCFMPISYGGGIKSLKDAEKVFQWGVEKISFNITSVPASFVKKVVERYGSQSVSLVVDFKRNLLKKYKVFDYKNRRKINLNLKEIKSYVSISSVGEVILQDVSSDGLRNGFSIPEQIIREFINLNIQVVAGGGIGSLKHIAHLFGKGVNGVTIGSYSIYASELEGVLISYPSTEDFNDLYEIINHGNL